MLQPFSEETMAMFGTVMVLLSLVSAAHSSDDQHGVLQCEPQNVLLWNVSQELLMSWEDQASCVSVRDQVTYELLVLIGHKPVHKDEVVVLADDVGKSHFWNWTASLPLECASHSVAIRSRYNNQSCPWRTETLPGQEPSEQIQVYPQDAVFAVGSRVTFCCIVPPGENFSSISVSNYPDAVMSNPLALSYHAFARTVDLLWPTRQSQADVICETGTDLGGACFDVGYPPSDSDLKCETRDFQSVQCYWTVGRGIASRPTEYQLLEQPCSKQSAGTCSKKVKVDKGMRRWTLKAQNVLGTIELTDQADLTKRVFMLAPENLTSVVSARAVTLRWTWTIQEYYHLYLTCQIQLDDGATHVRFHFEKHSVGLHSVVLSDLIPNWDYSAKVQCATQTDFWKWSDWSEKVSFHTDGDVPDALDVWMYKANQQTLIIWKLLEDKQSHGQITEYEVTWKDVTKEQQNSTRVVHPNRSVALNLSSLQEYIVKVIAWNEHGHSDPSQIIIPAQAQKCPDHSQIVTPAFSEERSDTPDISISPMNGSGGGFSLSWEPPAPAGCGYIVDWCPVSGDCIVDWLKVPSTNTSANIYSETFRAGVRYLLSLYTCKKDAPLLLGRREGYTKELKISDNLFKNLEFQQHGSDVEISWEPIALKEQSAFIQGYVLYCRHESTEVKVFTADPQATSLKVTQLNITSYTFRVCALTSEGECGSTSIDAKLIIQTDHLVIAVIVSLGTAFALFLLITVVCYRHWACIKQKVYPPIPQPVLTEKWSSPYEVLPYRPKEEQTLPVSELYRTLPTSTNGYICQRGQPPPRLTVIPNPVYTLQNTPDSQDAQQHDFSDYQPHLMEEFVCNQTDSDSIMSCVSTYIVLPHSSENKEL